MVIVNGHSHDPKGGRKLEEIRKNLFEILNQLSCPNNCTRDMLIRLEYHERKERIKADVYGPCCPGFEREINLYIRPYLK